ncbi:Class III cytochrome C family protein [Phycisphaerae bacterium RAS1]|nr:Class III cytochrome C family protein [Phycisphaerae bacterium RAS1]
MPYDSRPHAEWKEPAIDAYLFPKWTNGLKHLVLGGIVGGALYAVIVVTFGFAPTALDVGYMPAQPIRYSHALHAGELGMDCRYCHTTVESAAHAAIPATQTCYNCHANIQPNAGDAQKFKLQPLVDSYNTGNPVAWVKVHDLPDYAYFNHSAHINRGVGCVTCHGRVDRMEEVYQFARLSMSWCLDCHREPEKFLRPLDKITDMEWTAGSDAEQLKLGLELKARHGIRSLTDCSTCHR